MVVLSIVNRLWYLGDIWSLTVQSVAAVAPHDDVHLPHSHVTLLNVLVSTPASQKLFELSLTKSASQEVLSPFMYYPWGQKPSSLAVVLFLEKNIYRCFFIQSLFCSVCEVCAFGLDVK